MDNQQIPPPQNDIDARIAAERHVADTYQNAYRDANATPVQSTSMPNILRNLPQKKPILLLIIPLVFLFGIIAAATQSNSGDKARKENVVAVDEQQSLDGSSAGDYVVGEDQEDEISNNANPDNTTSTTPTKTNTGSTNQTPPKSKPIKNQPVIKNPPTKPPTIIGTPPKNPTPAITLVSRKTFAPTTYIFTANTTIKKIPGGETASSTVYKKDQKTTIVELRTYSNGKSFYLVKSQVDGGGKTGFLTSVMKKYVAPPPKVTKVLVIIEENHSFSQMKASMPFTFALGKRYGYATGYYAMTHPSLPNYLAISAGQFPSTKTVPPSKLKLKGSTVFGRAFAHGKTAKIYAESMTSNCQQSDNSKYKVKHNPWAYYVDERSLCNKYDVPFANNFYNDNVRGTLPNVGMVVPNICNDAHDCSLATADNWVKSVFTSITKGPDWKAGRLAVVITADEDDGNHKNNILTVIAHPSLKGKVVTSYLTHYSLTRLYSEVVGDSPLRNGAKARSLAGSFGLPL